MAAIVGCDSSRSRRLMGWPGGDEAFLEDATVEAAAAAALESLDKALVADLDAELEAGEARLADLEDGFADGEDVADVQVGFEQAGDGEVFAERAIGEVASQLLRSMPGSARWGSSRRPCRRRRGR